MTYHVQFIHSRQNKKQASFCVCMMESFDEPEFFVSSVLINHPIKVKDKILMTKYRSQNSIRKVLESIIQGGGQRV